MPVFDIVDGELSLPEPSEAPKPAKTRGGKDDGRYDELFAKADADNNLPSGMTKAIANAETGFLGDWDRRLRAVSPVGAQGPVQFMPATGRRYGLNSIDDLRNPEKAIPAAGKYLADIRETVGFDDPAIIAAGYNAGEHNRYVRAGKVPPPSFAKGETNNYVKNVMEGLSRFGSGMDAVRQMRGQPEATQDEGDLFSLEGVRPIEELAPASPQAEPAAAASPPAQPPSLLERGKGLLTDAGNAVEDFAYNQVMDPKSVVNNPGQTAKNLGSAALSGVYRGSEGVLGTLQAGAEATNKYLTGPVFNAFGVQDPVQQLAQTYSKARQGQKTIAERLTPQADSDLASGVYSGMQSITQNLMTIPAAVVTGNPLMALAPMGVMSGGQSYGEARDAGKSPERAALYGTTQGIIEVGTETIPMGKLLGSLKANDALWKTFAKQLVPEMLGEQAATFLQDLDKWVELNPDKTAKEFMAERPSAAIQTAVATLVGTGGQVLLGKAADVAAKRWSSENKIESLYNKNPMFMEILKTETDPSLSGIERAKQARDIMAQRLAAAATMPAERDQAEDTSISSTGIPGDTNAQDPAGASTAPAEPTGTTQAPIQEGQSQAVDAAQGPQVTDIAPEIRQVSDNEFQIVDANTGTVISQHPTDVDAFEALDQLNASTPLSTGFDRETTTATQETTNEGQNQEANAGTSGQEGLLNLPGQAPGSIPMPAGGQVSAGTTEGINADQSASASPIAGITTQGNQSANQGTDPGIQANGATVAPSVAPAIGGISQAGNPAGQAPGVSPQTLLTGAPNANDPTTGTGEITPGTAAGSALAQGTEGGAGTGAADGRDRLASGSAGGDVGATAAASTTNNPVSEPALERQPEQNTKDYWDALDETGKSVWAEELEMPEIKGQAWDQLPLPARRLIKGVSRPAGNKSLPTQLTPKQESELRGQNAVQKQLGQPLITPEQYLASQGVQSDIAASNTKANDQDVIDEYNTAVDTLNAGGTGDSGGVLLQKIKTATTLPRRGFVQRRIAESIAQVFGHRVVYIEHEDGTTELDRDGAIIGSRPDVILLNKNSQDTFSRVVAHELTHGLRRRAPKIYADMVTALREVYSPIGVSMHLGERNYEQELPKKGDTIVGRPGLTDPSRNEEEWVSDFVSDVIHKPTALFRVAVAMNKQRPGAGGKFLRAVDGFMSGLIQKLQGAGFNAEAAIAKKDLQRARNAVTEALAQYANYQQTGSAPEYDGPEIIESRKRKPDLQGGEEFTKRENVADYQMEVERKDRATKATAALSEDEKAAITKAVTEAGADAKAAMSVARETKKRFPQSAGWDVPTAIGMELKEDKKGAKNPVIQWAKIPYRFHLEPGQDSARKGVNKPLAKKIASKMVKEVEAVIQRAKKGDKNAAVIMGHANWYRKMAERLRTEFGGFADIFADLLGATSPNTAVEQNWNNAIDVMKRFVRGDFDSQLNEFDQWLKDGKSVKDFKDNKPEQLITRITGAKYGMNSDKAMKALLGLWRAVKKGDAPKARNFALNLVALSDKATIDVWAARFLQRLSGYPRIPTVSEDAVQGNHLTDPANVGGAFGFGQEAFEQAAETLRSHGLDIRAPDLQAIVWFLEKEHWTKNNWTSKAGEGGSFEEQLDKEPAYAWQAGYTIAKSGPAPENAEMAAEIKRINPVLKNDPDVIAYRILPTQGLYAGWPERSFDQEVIATTNWDPSKWISTLAEGAQREEQYDMFVSRKLGLNEEHPNARPGIEVAFKRELTAEEVQPIMDTIVGKGIDGFTLTVNPIHARTLGDTGQETDKFAGLRLQYVPEIFLRAVNEGWASLDDAVVAEEHRRLTSGDATLIDDVLTEKKRRMLDAVRAVYNHPDIADAKQYDYSTLVIGKENYGNYTGSDKRFDSIFGAGRAQESVVKRLEAAARRLRDGAGAVGGSNVLQRESGGPDIPASNRRPDAASNERSGGESPAAGRPTYGQTRRGAIRAVGVHYSSAERQELDGSKYGTGATGAEADRVKNAADKRLANRIYFYINAGQGVSPEQGVGGNAHTVLLKNLYDKDSDPLQILENLTGSNTAEYQNNMESAIIDAGFDGYVADFGNQRAAVLIGNHKVPVRFEGQGRPQVEEGERAEPNANKRLARLMGKDWSRKTPQAWGEYVKSINPALYDRYAASFAGTSEKFWPDEMASRAKKGVAVDIPASNRRQTSTPEFKRWFGKSTIVDESGNPRVMYHGTNADIARFNIGQADAIFVTPDPGFASGFSEDKGRTGANVMPVYVAAENPFDYDNAEHVQALTDWLVKNHDGKITVTMPRVPPMNLDPADLGKRTGTGNWLYIESKPVQEYLKAHHDGFWVKERGKKNLGVYQPTQIKSASGNRGTFSKDDPDIVASNRRNPNPTFYSQLARGFESSKMNSMPGSQWRAWLFSNKAKLGIKDDEIAWTGIEDYLTLNAKEKLTKADIASYLADNGVRVEEVMKGGKMAPPKELQDYVDYYGGDTSTTDGLLEIARETEQDAQRFQRNGMPDQAQARFRIAELANEMAERGEVGAAAPKFASYTIPGGTNYQELLITLPTDQSGAYTEENVKPAQDDRRGGQPDLFWYFTVPGNFLQIRKSKYPNQAAAKAYIIREKQPEPPPDKTYRSSHWDEKNVLAHIRFDERTDADGNKVMFITELQSDWGQEGKKKGFGDVRGYRVVEPSGQLFGEYGSKAEAESALSRAKPGSIVELSDNFYRGVPQAPFVTDTKSWLSLGLKRAIRYAAENGFDKIAFANGQQNADLYDLSKQVDYIDYKKTGDDQYQLAVIGKNGDEVSLPKDTYKADELEDVVGKEIAQKIVNGEGQSGGGRTTLRGLDLKVGGEGMRTFYDKIVPQTANEVLKKLGGQRLSMVSISTAQDLSDTPEDLVVRINETSGGRFRVGVGAGEARRAETFDTREQAQAWADEQVAAAESGRYSSQPGFDITPALQDKALDGMPLFSNRRNVLNQPALATWTTPDDSKLDNYVYLLQDKHIDTKRIVEKLGSRVSDAWDPYLKETLYHGRAAKDVDDFKVNEIKPLLQAMSTRGITIGELETFLHNRHAKEANEQIARINEAYPDGGSGILTQDAQAYLNNLPAGKRTDLEAMAAQIDAITAGTRRLLVDSGLETQDTIDVWEATYADYVPLQRESEDVLNRGMGTGRGFSTKGPASKRRTGSGKAVVDIMANVMMQRERAITRAEKNKVGLALYGLAIQNPNPEFWYPVNPDAVKKPASVAQELVNNGMLESDLAGIIQEPTVASVNPRTGLVEYKINPALRNRDNVLAVRIKGKDRFLFFSTENERAVRMAQSLKNLDAPEMHRVLNLLRYVTRYVSSINTQYNPIFGVVNLLRDTQGAMLNLSTTPIAGKQAEVAAKIAPAMAGIYGDLRADRKGKPRKGSQWSQLWEEFQTVGGKTGYRDMYATADDRMKALEKELKAIQDGKVKRLTRGLFDWLSDYNETLENAVRLSAYKVGTESGMSKEQAAVMAKELTVNFNRKGLWASEAGALWAFFNAAVQGTARLAETVKGPAGKKIVAGGLIMGVVQAMIMAAAGYDDDEPPEFLRERNFIIPIPNGKYVSIPLPLGFHVLPNTGRVLTEIALNPDEGGKKMIGLLASFMEAFNPIGSAKNLSLVISPTVSDPIVSLDINRDAFGKEIAKKDRSATSPTPGFTRTKDTASWLSKQLAWGLNRITGGTDYTQGAFSPTPDQLDYVFSQATGGVGREVMKIEQAASAWMTGEELPPYKYPLGVGRFVGDVKSQSAESNRFYANLTRLNELESEIKGRAKDGKDVAGFLRSNPLATLVPAGNQMERAVSELRSRKRKLIAQNAPKATIKALEGQIATQMKVLNDRVKAVAR